MAEGKEGLRRWKESVYFFLNEGHDTALRRALEVGRDYQDEHQEGRKWVETRLADIVTLNNLGSNPIEFEVNLGTKKPGTKTRTLRSHRPGDLRVSPVPGLCIFSS
jgi:hypothetical protein